LTFEQSKCIVERYVGALLWEVRKHRNNIVFNDGKLDNAEIFSLAQLRGWMWMKHKVTKVNFSYSDYYFCPLIWLKTITWRLCIRKPRGVGCLDSRQCSKNRWGWLLRN